MKAIYVPLGVILFIFLLGLINSLNIFDAQISQLLGLATSIVTFTFFVMAFL